MKLSANILVALSSALLATACPTPANLGQSCEALEKRGITQDLYHELVWYWKYATSANLDSCPHPMGNVLVKQINRQPLDIRGYIARDDKRKEIIIAFRPTRNVRNGLVDLLLIPVPFVSPGLNAPPDTLVHVGFLTAWNSVADEVIRSLRAELNTHPDYTFVTSGHSLGGALASIAAIVLKQNFPDIPLRMFTYGQPRVGNHVYADFVNAQVGADNIFRSVHTSDGVPAVPPRSLGYWHHATEYWQNPDPSSPSTVKKCDGPPLGEDPSCSNKILSGAIDPHFAYYGTSGFYAYCSPEGENKPQRWFFDTII